MNSHQLSVVSGQGTKPLDAVEQIAVAVLYEGYLLWPYRRSAIKNQKRWTFGGVYPRAYSAAHPDDPWLMQTQCLVVGDNAIVTIKVRFLQVVERRVGRLNLVAGEGSLDFVDELVVDGRRYLTWDEATEREITLEALPVKELATPCQVKVAISAGHSQEPLTTSDGQLVGALVRKWRTLEGKVEVEATAVAPDVFRLTVKTINETPWPNQDRVETLKQTFISTHTILTAMDGAFVSLMDPPEALRALAEQCENIKTWPVLAGEAGDRHTLLSSPIILYDYPQIAPESPGDLFDGTEIDQLLILNILTLTDEEKEEMQATDARAREILERSESLTTADFMRLHGAIREFQVLREEK